MLGVPAPTPLDLRFRLLGFPVRISPWFWALALFVGWPYVEDDPTLTLVVALCVFVSILVHEFGHGVVSKLFGYRVDEIILHGFGGLCVSEPNQRFWPRLLMLAAGPGAGFLLFGLALLAEFWLAATDRQVTRPAGVALGTLVFVNLWWGLLNLLPIWPMDGGQITGTILGRVNPRDGRRWTHIIGLLGAGALAAFFFSRGSTYAAIIFGLMAFNNFQILQVLHNYAVHGVDVDGGDDWWKR